MMPQIEMRNNDQLWSFWIDRGGTFTDIVARRPDGNIVSHKLLSENPDQYKDAALQGIRDLMEISRQDVIPHDRIKEVKMGTTVGTNALLERKGEPVLLLITKGFRDALRIGYQNRPHLFDLHIRLSDMLYQVVEEIDERISAGGHVLVPLDQTPTLEILKTWRKQGIKSVAIIFMHGYRYPQNEQMAAELAGKAGFEQISVSHGVSPLIKLVSRGDTTMVDAYLSPILHRYVDRVAGELGNTRLMFMKSDGGLTDAHLFAGKDCILSGPAGGVVGAAKVAMQAGFHNMIGFDMGGTSTDVCHYSGEFERAYETEVGGVRMRAPMMMIHTVAAGGGSILHFDGSRFRVGPDSAGADPGPASYRRGGPLTVTDCNLMTSKILPQYFPAIFGKQADQSLDVEVVRQKFTTLAREVKLASDEEQTPEAIADGFLAIAVENMANAIKKISVQRGYDVSRYILVCFGGAGGQHACQVADKLGMQSVLLHPHAGVLSAYGMGLADITAMAEKSIGATIDENVMPVLQKETADLAETARLEVEKQGVHAEHIFLRKKVHVRYAGSDTILLVELGTLGEISAAFEKAHRQMFGFIDQGKTMVAEAVIVEAVGRAESSETSVDVTESTDQLPAAALRGESRIFSQGEWQQCQVFDRSKLLPGNRFTGPAIIIEPHSTIVVEKEWQGEVTERKDILLTRGVPRKNRHAIGTEVDPVMLEIFNNLYMSIAEQMGTVLAKTAHSVNIKERLDFSCAVFDPRGNLVANAPHVPVHLGSMSESIKAIITARKGGMKQGDVYALNAPYNGGTHLPDITIITPVMGGTGKELLFYVASRGHHADIGGLTPGSMPPYSKTVIEEGVLFDDFLLVEGGVLQEKKVYASLVSGAYPARNPEQNIADLKAQIAANEMGVRELRKMVDSYGLDVVQAYMQHVQDNAEEAVRRVIDHLHDGEFSYEMDNGAAIKVKVSVHQSKRRAIIDFSGTSKQLDSNYNAPLAVCKAAVLYVFRCMVQDDIPLNEGCLKPLEVIVPAGSMLNPNYPAAVVAGNVETSQCIVDALFGAMQVVAASQGTMNNFTFGNAQWQYYETIAGGAGAGPDFDGASAVQTHMTNSRLTDPEVLESRFPVLLEEFVIRQGSGGNGKHRGGDGVMRCLRFLEPMTASILSNNRHHAPKGMQGGGDGMPGINRIVGANGTEFLLDYAASAELHAGDVVVIETPGGGGFGHEEG